MLENGNSLLPYPKERSQPLRAFCVGDERASLEEINRLLNTLKVETVGQLLCEVRKINPATYIGLGKIEEIIREAELPGENKENEEVHTGRGYGAPKRDVDVVIVDFELSPNQMRNLETALGKPVLDRTGVILEIFSRHARTKEAKNQVELARLQYLLPRLAHFWDHFERQSGGGTNRGMGEKQIEVDRRLVKKRMSILRDRLKEIEKERNVQRAGREDVLKVAIVGYTNAGKSTLLNQLTHSAVLAEDKLFATLDPSIRMLDPNAHPPVVAIDTVGFIDRLPTSLVASFRSTLEEVLEADLIVHVVDASSPEAKSQLKVTEDVLAELGAGDKPRMTVLNKADALGGTGPLEKNRARVISPGSLLISALNRDDVIKLRDQIMAHFRKDLVLLELILPYEESKLEAKLHQFGKVEVTRHLEKGTFLRVRIEESWAKKLDLERFRT